MCVVGEDDKLHWVWGMKITKKMHKIKLKMNYAGSAVDNVPQTKECDWSCWSYSVCLRAP